MGCRWYDSMARLSPCEGRPRTFVAWFEADPVLEIDDKVAADGSLPHG